MKFFAKFFSQGEVQSNVANENKTVAEMNNKNMQLICDVKFDLNGILSDFDAKINFLYEKISKMEKTIKDKDARIQKLAQLVDLENECLADQTSLAFARQSNNSKPGERVSPFLLQIRENRFELHSE